MPLFDRSHLEQIRGDLVKDRSGFEAHWWELGDFLKPRRIRKSASDRNRGDKRNQNIIDSTATFALRTLQSGLHAGLTSPARPWFKLTTPDPDLGENKAVKEWLHVVTQRMQVVMSNSNIYQALSIVYGDLGGFGTGCVAIIEDDQDLLRAYNYPIGTYAIGMDARNVVSSFVRDYELTVRQVVETFARQPGTRDLDWSKVSITVKDAWDKGQYEQRVEVCWLVIPNPDPDPDRLEAKYLPWRSWHFERGQNREHSGLLRESGFRSFPILAPRWETTGEDTYGTDCPGMTALGDIKQLQLQQKEKAKAIKKLVDPPLVGVPELRTQKTSLLPGDITYVREPQYGLRAIHEIRLDLGALTTDIQDVRYMIRRAFFEDLFLMLATADVTRESGQPITAREVEERHEEKLLALGPVLERTNDELLDPLIDRTFMLMEQSGLLPPPPEELQGVNLQVEYVSLMAQAQKLVGVVGQDRFIASVMPLAEAFPELRHKVDIHQIVDNYAEMLGVDPRIIRSKEETEGRQAAEAQQQQAQMEAEQMRNIGAGLKDAANAPVGTGSALDRVLQNAAAEPSAVM